MGIFAWIRSSVKAAFLAGLQDAIDELQTVEERIEPVALQLDYRPVEEPVRNGRAARHASAK